MKKIKKQLTYIQSYRRVNVAVFRSRDVVDDDMLLRMQGYTQLRTDYVLQEQWPMHSSGVDLDEYDTLPSTRYVVAMTGEKVVAGMRLTPVDSIEESMSYRMWDGFADKTSFDRQFSAAEKCITIKPNEQLFDVTRLVTEASILQSKTLTTKYDSRAGLIKSLARATMIHDTAKSPVWVFTTTPALLSFMKRNHFPACVVVEGTISATDTDKSYMCIVRPHVVLKKLRTSNPLLYAVSRHQRKRVAV